MILENKRLYTIYRPTISVNASDSMHQSVVQGVHEYPAHPRCPQIWGVLWCACTQHVELNDSASTHIVSHTVCSHEFATSKLSLVAISVQRGLLLSADSRYIQCVPTYIYACGVYACGVPCSKDLLLLLFVLPNIAVRQLCIYRVLAVHARLCSRFRGLEMRRVAELGGRVLSWG